MSKSPGHRQWPDHKVIERPSGERVRVVIDAETVADSNDVIKVEEDGFPARYLLSSRRPQHEPTGALRNDD